MSGDPNKKSARTFQCRDVLWETFEQMARDLECSIDYLINEAMKQYARQRSYGARTPFPASGAQDPAAVVSASADAGAASAPRCLRPDAARAFGRLSGTAADGWTSAAPRPGTPAVGISAQAPRSAGHAASGRASPWTSRRAAATSRHGTAPRHGYGTASRHGSTAARSARRPPQRWPAASSRPGSAPRSRWLPSADAAAAAALRGRAASSAAASRPGSAAEPLRRAAAHGARTAASRPEPDGDGQRWQARSVLPRPAPRGEQGPLHHRSWQALFS